MTILDFSYKFENYLVFQNNETERLIVINYQEHKKFFMTNDQKFKIEKDIDAKKENGIPNKSNISHLSEEIEKSMIKQEDNNRLDQSLSAHTERIKFKKDSSHSNSTYFANLNEINKKINFDDTNIPSIFIDCNNKNESFKISILNKENKFFISELINKKVLLKISQPLQFNKQMKKIKLIKGNLRISLIKTKKKFTFKSFSDILCFGNYFLKFKGLKKINLGYLNKNEEKRKSNSIVFE